MKKKWVALGAVMTIFIAAYVAYANDSNDGNDGITIWIHSTKVDSESVKMENGTTFVPLRVIAENLNQDVQWNPKTKTVTVDETLPSYVERMVIQKGKNIYVSDSENFQMGSQAILSNLYDLYGMTYRGVFVTDPDKDRSVTKTEKDLSFIQDSLTTVESSVESSYNYVRLVLTPYIPQPGQNAPPRKDIIFYVESQNPNDLYIAVQNPEKLTEWQVDQVKDYGGWLEKEVDIYLRDTRGSF